MTTQREKDLARGCNEALKHRFADHPSFADGFADGAAYGRKDAAKRLRECISGLELHDYEEEKLLQALIHLEADE